MLDIESVKAKNRIGLSMLGEPHTVIEAAFKAIKAGKLIDLSRHKGEPP
jgi:glutamate formiminotransferase